MVKRVARKMKHHREEIIHWTFVVCLVFFSVFNGFLIPIDSLSIWEVEQRRADVHQYGKEEVNRELHAYLQDRSGVIETELLNQKEKDHMVDVKILVMIARYLRIACILGLVGMFWYERRRVWEFIRRGLRIGGYASFGVVGFFGIMALTFNASFYYFHELFFTNDLWLMDPATDMIIYFYPQDFFLGMFLWSAGLLLLQGGFWILGSWWLGRK